MMRIAPRRHGAALFWLVAIACFLATLAAVAARVSYRAADAYAAGLRGALTVRIISPDTDEAVERAATALRSAAGIYSAKAVTPHEAAALLSRWGAPGVAPADLPPMRLIELEVNKAQATPAFARRVEHALAQIGFTAEVYGPGQWIETWAQVADRARWAIIAIAAGLGLAALFTAGLAGRARAAADRALIAPLADMGATRGQVAAMFAGRGAIEGLLAGTVGAAAAAAAAFAVFRLAPDMLHQFVPGALLSQWLARIGWQDAALILAAPPLLAALLTAAGARAAANRAYWRAARLS